METLGAGLEKRIGSCEWIEDLIALPSKIDKILSRNNADLMYKHQCHDFYFLVDCVAENAKKWHAPVTEAAKTFGYTAAGVELLRVLNSGMKIVQFCADKSLPGVLFTILGSLGQFCEIFDDVTRYLQMMEDFLHLKNVINIDCNNLKEKLKAAYKKDKLELLNSLKALESTRKDTVSILLRGLLFRRGTIKDLPFDYVLNGLIPVLEKGLSPTTLCMDRREIFIQNHLYSGSYESIFRARWCHFEVAVQCMRNGFEDEFEAHSKMVGAESSHIVQILGHCESKKIEGRGKWTRTSTEKLLVFELMSADLGVVIRKEKIDSLTLLQSVDIMLQIAKAMKHLHHNNVIHRDLKPNNIWIEPVGDSYLIKLAGFYVSKTNFETGFHTSPQGTAMYMAPEIYKDLENYETKYSKKVDVFSFGITCSQLFTGGYTGLSSNPFNSNPFKFQKMLQGEVQKLGIPCKLKLLISNCLEHDENARPTFSEICDELWLIIEQLLTLKLPCTDASTSQDLHVKGKEPISDQLSK